MANDLSRDARSPSAMFLRKGLLVGVFLAAGLTWGPGCGDGNPPRGSIAVSARPSRGPDPGDAKIAAKRGQGRGAPPVGNSGRR